MGYPVGDSAFERHAYGEPVYGHMWAEAYDGYWRSLDAEQRVDLPLSLIAAIPGTYTGPASRAYQYYTDEHKHWIPPMSVEIAAK